MIGIYIFDTSDGGEVLETPLEGIHARGAVLRKFSVLIDTD